MPNDSFSETFSQYLSSSPNHHAKLFEMLDQIIEEDPSLSRSFCLEIIHHILSNMEPTFVERRGITLFRFLLTQFSCQKKFSKKHRTPIVKYLPHEVAFPFQNKQVLGFFVQLQGTYGEVESLKQSFLDRHQEILLIEHTTLPYILFKKNCTLLYFEVQKREGDFSPDELGDLLEYLEEIALALTSRWKTAIPSMESDFPKKPFEQKGIPFF